VVLIGMPGAGKTTIGRRLAATLGVPFADSDDLVEAATGHAVRQVFEQSGEPAFRRAEAEAIAGALRTFDGVLALGGGAVTTESVRESLAAAGVPVVWLNAPLGSLTSRVGDGRTRPLLAGDPRGPTRRLAELARNRAPLYRDMASLTVDTAGRTPGQVAAFIAAQLGDRAGRG
jgi:shikimate kinase